MNSKYQFFFLLLIHVFFSCSSPKTNLENDPPFADTLKNQDLDYPKSTDPQPEILESSEPSSTLDYELAVEDSIFIQETGILSLMAVHPTRDLFLLMEGIMGEKLKIYDRKGKILAELKKPKDAPDGYGGVCSGATFSGDAIFVHGLQGIYEFDLQLNFKKKYPKTFYGNTVMVAGDNIASAKISDREGVFVFTGQAKNDYPRNSPRHYEEFNSLEWLDFQKGELQPILPLLPDSYLLKAKASFDSYQTYFKVKGSRLVYCFNLEPSIYTVSLSQNPLKPTRSPLPIQGFIYEKGYPFGSQKEIEDRRTIPGSIQGIYQAPEMDLIVYSKGLEKDRFPDGIQDRHELRKEIHRRDPKYWILHSKAGDFSKEKPIGFKFKIVRSDSKGRLWAVQNLDYLESEPEGFMIYALKLVEK